MSKCAQGNEAIEALYKTRRGFLKKSFKRQIGTQLRKLKKFLTSGINQGNVFHRVYVKIQFKDGTSEIIDRAGRDLYVRLQDPIQGLQLWCKELELALQQIAKGKKVPTKVFTVDDNLFDLHRFDQKRGPLRVELSNGVVQTITEAKPGSREAKQDLLSFQRRVPAGVEIKKWLST